MTKKLLIVIMGLAVFELAGQNLEQYHQSIQQYEPSEEFPFGRINPNAPEELKQFEFMVGVCECVDSVQQRSGDWLSFPSIWSAKYFLNGFGIQDNNFNPQNPTSNIRLFDKSTSEWKVTYVSVAQQYFTGEWVGKKEDDEIVLYRKNGDDQPYSRLSFYNISEQGFDWKSETIFPNGDISVGWNKKCKKR